MKEKNMLNINIEELIPHRDQMKLADKIIEAGEQYSVTESIATDKWPLAQDDGVNPLVLIELAAQTSAICVVWKEFEKNGKTKGGKGWLVGIKKADFYIDTIPFNSRITTRSEINYSMENLTEIKGISKIGEDIIGEMKLQVFRSDEEKEAD
ncbi:hypothetical protein QUF70_19195 [Desulfobacterales bacterium HSG17]|nr:hypothetical protein [Desulfobacterales bacterium HSG17]